MPSRDDVVRYSVLENALRTTLRSLPCCNQEDARRWVSFACQCVRHTPPDADASPSIPMHEQPSCLHGFQLAERWARGEDVPAQQLQEAWRSASRDAETLTAKMTGPRAALWSVLCTIEAAMNGAMADGAEPLRKLAQAVESAARYARQADPARWVDAAKLQKDVLDQMLRDSKVG